MGLLEMLCVKGRKVKLSCSTLSVSILPSRGIEPAAEPGQSFLVHISSLPDASKVVNANLRVLHWRSPETDPDSATLPPLLHLHVCPDAARTSSLLYSRTAEPLEVACWEELDVTDAVHSHRRKPCASCKFLLPAGQGWQRQ